MGYRKCMYSKEFPYPNGKIFVIENDEDIKKLKAEGFFEHWNEIPVEQIKNDEPKKEPPPSKPFCPDLRKKNNKKWGAK